MAAAFSLGGSLLEAEDVLEAVIEKMHAATLCQLKAASVAWGALVRRELCKRLWVRLCQREGQPEPSGVDNITDLDVECLNEAGTHLYSHARSLWNNYDMSNQAKQAVRDVVGSGVSIKF